MTVFVLSRNSSFEVVREFCARVAGSKVTAESKRIVLPEPPPITELVPNCAVPATVPARTVKSRLLVKVAEPSIANSEPGMSRIARGPLINTARWLRTMPLSVMLRMERLLRVVAAPVVGNSTPPPPTRVSASPSTSSTSTSVDPGVVRSSVPACTATPLAATLDVPRAVSVATWMAAPEAAVTVLLSRTIL